MVALIQRKLHEEKQGQNGDQHNRKTEIHHGKAKICIQNSHVNKGNLTIQLI